MLNAGDVSGTLGAVVLVCTALKPARMPSFRVTLKANEVHYALSLVSGPEEVLGCSYSVDR